MVKLMNNVLRYGLQVFNYMIFTAVVWYFSIKPAYHQLEKDQAVITLSFTHATKLREECRKLSQEEFLNLAPNMRVPMDCPRARSPLRLELYLDDKLIKNAALEPPGFHSDQSISLFQRIKVRTGEHKLRVWMNDDINREGSTYQHEQTVILKPEQQVLLDFDVGSGGFFLN
jgi:hypothetical protein